MSKKTLCILFLGALLATGLLFGRDTANANPDWPTKKVTIVVPTGPGGSADRISRGMAPYLSKELGATVVIENRPGGNSVVGTVAHLKGDPADGSFWLLSTSPMFEASTLQDVPYRIEDFDYISLISWDPLGIFVQKDSPFMTLEQLLDAIKANPDKLKYSDVPASWGLLLMRILEEEILHSKTVRVPFRKGGAAPRTMLLGKHVDFLPAPYCGTMAAMGSEVRCLGITKYEPSAPQVPLIQEITRKYSPDVDIPKVIFTRHLDIKKPFKSRYPERWELMAQAIKALFENDDFKNWNNKSGLGLRWNDPQESDRLVYQNMRVISKYSDVFR
jgi:putative tricarboxylic transport membrane protein